MNLQQLTRRVQRGFGDESGAQITASDIRDWLNDALVDVCKKTEQFEQSLSFESEPGQEYITLSDYITIRRVSFNGNKLHRSSLEEIDQFSGQATEDVASSEEGEPRYFYVWGKQLFFHPVPSVAGQINVLLLGMPTLLSDPEDVPGIPAHMHEDLVRYALARAKELDEDHVAAAAIMGDYEHRLLESKQLAHSPENDSYPSVRALPGDGGDWPENRYYGGVL